MSRRVLVINVALGIVSVVLAVGVFRILLAKPPLPPPPQPRAVSAPAPAVTAQVADAGPGEYGVVSARSLFNPNRSETTAVVAAAPVAKPILHGVVMNGARSRAFLEDPTFKRVAGYSVGDAVGGGTIDKIADDRVVITRPEGPLEILLQDPTKPRPAPTPVAARAVVSPVQVGSPPIQTPPALPQVNPVSPAVPQLRQGMPIQRQPDQ